MGGRKRGGSDAQQLESQTDWKMVAKHQQRTQGTHTKRKPAGDDDEEGRKEREEQGKRRTAEYGPHSTKVSNKNSLKHRTASP